jgi:hypothetical protein
MPAVGFVLLINRLSNTARRDDALTAAVPGLMVGAVSGERWPVASWADHPRQVEEQAQALRAVDGILDVEVACVDWRGDSTASDIQFDWSELRGRRRTA